MILVPLLIIILFLASFSNHLEYDFSLFGDRKSPQISRILLNFQDDFNSAVVWIVSILTQTSSLSYLFSIFLETIPRTPTKYMCVFLTSIYLLI